MAKNIATLMQARGTDAARLARDAGINPTGVYDILSGKSRSPKIETIGKLATALGVPVALVFEEEPMRAARNQLLAAYEALPDEKRALLLQTALAWLGQAESA